MWWMVYEYDEVVISLYHDRELPMTKAKMLLGPLVVFGFMSETKQKNCIWPIVILGNKYILSKLPREKLYSIAFYLQLKINHVLCKFCKIKVDLYNSIISNNNNTWSSTSLLCLQVLDKLSFNASNEEPPLFTEALTFSF